MSFWILLFWCTINRRHMRRVSTPTHFAEWYFLEISVHSLNVYVDSRRVAVVTQMSDDGNACSFGFPPGGFGLFVRAEIKRRRAEIFNEESYDGSTFGMLTDCDRFKRWRSFATITSLVIGSLSGNSDVHVISRGAGDGSVRDERKEVIIKARFAAFGGDKAPQPLLESAKWQIYDCLWQFWGHLMAFEYLNFRNHGWNWI